MGDWVVVDEPKVNASDSSSKSDWQIVPDSETTSTAQDIQGPAEKPTIANTALKTALAGVAGAYGSLPADEALKVAGQGVPGLDIANTPVKEAYGGALAAQLGISGEQGVSLGQKIMNNPKDIAKRIMLSGISGLADVLNKPDTGETLHTKYGLWVPPEPTSGIGKILGIGARITGQIAAAEAVGSFVNSLDAPKFKFPSSDRLDEASKQIASNIQTMKDTNKANIDIETSRAAYSNTKEAEDNALEITGLEVKKNTLADEQARYIQQKLGPEASRNLNKEYGPKYQAAIKGKSISSVDYTDSLHSYLEDRKILDEEGNLLIDPATLNRKNVVGKVYDLYEKAISNNPSDVYTLTKDGRMATEMPIEELDKNLKSVLSKGKKYSFDESELNNIRHQFSGQLADLNELNKEYAPKFQKRNGLFDEFNIYNRTGYRKGEVAQKSGSDLLKALTNENPAKIDLNHQRMMEFVKEYTGEDPSKPITDLGDKIKGIKATQSSNAVERQIAIDRYAAEIDTKQARSIKNAEDIQSNLGILYKSAKAKEEKIALIKKLTLQTIGATTGAAGTIFGIYKATK